MPDLRFGVLGALEVVVDGRPLAVPAGRRRAVLARLLVSPGRPVSADVLVEAAWGADVPRDPHSALHTVLSRLRSQLGDGAVEKGPEGYRLADPAVDAAEFETLLERAGTTSPPDARALLDRALGLWRGPAFGEYAEAPFAAAAAGRLELLRMDAVELRAGAMVESGDPAAAVVALEELVADEPFRERAVELLLTALYHAGRQAEALKRFRDYRTVLADELGLDPSPRLTALEARILGHGLPPARPANTGPPTWLDTSTAFVGREDELAELVAAVTTDRVTVVTGTGGVGKTRLAAEALAPVHGRLGLPTAVTELAATPPGRAATAVSDVLGLRLETGADVTDALVEYLGAVPHLLVLDNCEHLLDEVAPLVARLARRCPGTRVLATSRRRLGVESERVLPLEPLRVPDPTDTMSRQGTAAAVRLFTDRVRRLRPAFAVTSANTTDVAELCRRLDGLPLALELAASRTATSGVTEVLEGLPSDLVPGGTDDLRAVVAWSYRLLTDDQRRLLAVLSVFPGEFTGHAVRGVTSYIPTWQGDPVPALAELVEFSLVASRLGGGALSHRMLAIVRVFAAERLEGSGQAEQVRLAHASWVRDEVRAIAADWARADGEVLAARLDVTAAEARVAVRWALESGHTALACQLAHALARCLHWTPGWELREDLIRAAERGADRPGADVAGGMAAGAMFTAERGDLERARQLAREALSHSDAPDVTVVAALALGVAGMYSGEHAESARWFRRLAAHPGFAQEGNTSLALLACYADDLDAAREHADIALAVGPTGADASYAFARYAAGEVEARTDPDRAAVRLAEAVAEADRVGAEQVSRVSRVALLALLVRAGRHGEAVDLAERLLADLRRRGAWPQAWTTLRLLAELLAETGRPAEAAFLLGAAQGAASAPPPVGRDIERYAEVERRLADRLGGRVSARIRALAASTPRAQVLSRAEHALATVRVGG